MPEITEIPLIRPFAALRPLPRHADEIAAPPYDVMNVDEARNLAEGKQWSFLHVSRPEIDLAEGCDVHAPEVYAKGGENLARMVDAGILIREEKPCYYVYRMSCGDHVQTGIAAVASTKAYDANRVRRHELTRPDKENDRINHMKALGAQTGPVLVAHHPIAEIAEIISKVTKKDPLCEAGNVSGTAHTLWVIDDEGSIDVITKAFGEQQAIYIADGHHRSASASRVAASMAEANPSHRGDESYNSFLVVAFPADEMQILDYNRVVRDLGGLDLADFLRLLSSAFSIEPLPLPTKPAASGEFSMYLNGRWYGLVLNKDLADEADPTARLDVARLYNNLLKPILGIGDERTDKRIDFVGGARGLKGLQARVDSGEMAVAFALYPTSMNDLMAVAEAGKVMPPKSTWFEPKLADGLVCHVLD